MPNEGTLDLSEFHARAYRMYVGALIALEIASLVLNLTFGGAQFYANWWRDSVLTIVCLLACAVAFFVSARPIQLGVALLLAVLVTYFMIVACNVVVA